MKKVTKKKELSREELDHRIEKTIQGKRLFEGVQAAAGLTSMFAKEGSKTQKSADALFWVMMLASFLRMVTAPIVWLVLVLL